MRSRRGRTGRAPMGIAGAVFLISLSIIALLAVSPVTADMPWPPHAQGQDPGRFESYCRFESSPNDLPPSDPAYWKYSGAGSGSAYHASLEQADPELFRRELAGVTGDATEEAWRITTGRPDAVIAVLDAGVRWHDPGVMRDLVRKIYLNPGEVPPPVGAESWDRNGDGIFNIDDLTGDARAADRNGNGMLDPQDLIRTFSDGEDDDANGYVDDIAGWDFLEDDNDPWDESDVGSGDRACAWSGAEANNGSGAPGTCPNAMLLAVRVGYASPVDANRFAQGVVFAVDSGAWVIQAGMQGDGANSLSQAAVDYAYARGVPVILPAAGASTGGGGLPAYERAVQANAVTPYLVSDNGLLAQYPPSYLYLQDVDEGGAQTTLAAPADADRAEAVARLAGIAALVASAAEDRVGCGLMWDYPGLDRPLSANEVRQILAMTADDIDFSGVSGEASLGAVDLLAGPSQRFSTTPGWDPYSGYGRVNALRAVQAVVAGMIPPEAEITSPRWYDLRDPGEVSLQVSGRVAAVRSESYQFTVEWGPGWTPACDEWVSVATVGPRSEPTQGVLATLDLGEVYRAVEERAAQAGDRGGVDRNAFTVRVRVRDNHGNWGEDRKTLYVFHDEDSLPGAPLMMAGGVNAAPRAADLDGDGAEELLVATGDGAVHALKGGDLTELPGWPVRTTPLPLHLSSAGFASGALPGEAFAAVSGAPAVGDLDHDGDLEVVAADASGRIFAWDRGGNLLAGFPLRSHPLFSIPERAEWWTEGSLPADWHASRLVPDTLHRLDRGNRLERGFVGGPVLANLDASGDGSLEILATCLDRHVYAWHADGTVLRGWPVKLADPQATAGIDPLTHACRVNDQENITMGTGILTAPAVADLDGDGDLEVLCGSGEFYAGAGGGVSPSTFALCSTLPLIAPLLQGRDGNILHPGSGRIYALHGEGTAHGLEPGAPPQAEVPGNAYIAGWPARPAVTEPAAEGGAAGETGSLSVADVDGDGRMEIAVSAVAGPAFLLTRDGASFHGYDAQGLPLSLACSSAGAAERSRGTTVMCATGGGCFARLNGEKFCYLSAVMGLGGAIDPHLSADQAGSAGLLAVWGAVDGEMLASSPLPLADGICGLSPVVADIDGDGAQEILAGGSLRCLHAAEVAGGEAAGWPKFTGGHVVSSPAVGDLDGDGGREVVAGTREGWLFAWRTAAGAAAPADWPAYGHDAWNTGCLETDAQAPARVTDLAVEPLPGEGGSVLVRLSWTAPGDDGNGGTAMCYEVRYLGLPFDGNNWNEGVALLAGKPMPAVAGTKEEMTIEGMVIAGDWEERAYYFMLQARDEAGNLSLLSNVACLRITPWRARSLAPSAP